MRSLEKGNASGCTVKTCRLLTLALTSLMLMACAAAPTKTVDEPVHAFEIDGIEIRNELTIGITDVEILVPQTGDFVGCGNIVARTSCSTSFPGQQYQGHKVLVTWKERGIPHSTPKFVLTPPQVLGSGHPIWIEVSIFAPGQAGARLVQH